MAASRMNAGVTSSGSPNQNGSTSGSPIAALATSRICEARSDCIAPRAAGGWVWRIGMRIMRTTILYCVDGRRRKRFRHAPMRSRQLILIVLNALAIIACGGLGGLAGFGLARVLDLGGVPGAVVATVVGMVVATAAWAAGATLLRALRLVR